MIVCEIVYVLIHRQYMKKKLSPNPVDILSFDNIFDETNIAQGMIFEGKRCGIDHDITMDVEPAYKHFGKFSGGFQWYMMESKCFKPSINFNLKYENGKLVSFNGHSKTFRLSLKKLIVFNAKAFTKVFYVS